MSTLTSEIGVFILYLIIHNEATCEEGKGTPPENCLENYHDCVREPGFQSCKRNILTPSANITILSVKNGDTALLRCLDFNPFNKVMTPGFSWIKWATPTTSHLDLDNGTFTHIDEDGSRYFIRTGLHRQDLHAQWLSIHDFNSSDYALYTCVICTKFGRSHQSIYLKPNIQVTTTPAIAIVPIKFATALSTILSTTATAKTLESTNTGAINKDAMIALFIVGTLLLAIILIIAGFILRKKLLKHSSHEQPTCPASPAPSSQEDSPTIVNACDKRFNRKWSTSTSESSQRSSTSSTFPLTKYRQTNGRSPTSAMTYISETDTEEDVSDVFEPPAVDDMWELPREHIVLKEQLGEGAFGLVMKASAYGLQDKPAHCTVAVKTIRDDASDAEFSDFLAEIETMKYIGQHNNIINILGVCTLNGPILLIIEHAQHGNLRDFLREHRPDLQDRQDNNNRYPKPDDPLVAKILIPFSYQAAKGMEYLASKKCIHRDLAARNVLVTKDYVIKIADFGLSRNLQETDYYRKTTHGRLPVMWLPIEALFDQKYTIMSDVWSFGVLLWEIFTFGNAPYPGIPVETLFTLLKTGYRMPSPHNCPPDIYAMMLRCWSENPIDRPSMAAIASEFDLMLASSSSVEYLDIIGQSRDDLCDKEGSDWARDGPETNV